MPERSKDEHFSSAGKDAGSSLSLDNHHSQLREFIRIKKLLYTGSDEMTHIEVAHAIVRLKIMQSLVCPHQSSSRIKSGFGKRTQNQRSQVIMLINPWLKSM